MLDFKIQEIYCRVQGENFNEIFVSSLTPVTHKEEGKNWGIFGVVFRCLMACGKKLFVNLNVGDFTLL